MADFEQYCMTQLYCDVLLNTEDSEGMNDCWIYKGPNFEKHTLKDGTDLLYGIISKSISNRFNRGCNI